uniref:Transforming acidic coiled-coil-containing protein C-terminal domain-containing protein n=1 Tax=Magallana gigas TaxID=29159 RepID=A0A8W8IJ01_MAGGI
MDENLLELSENCENSLSGDTMPPLLMGTPPVVKKSILKPSQQDNLIQLCTPVHKGLKVKFETPHNVKKSTPTRFEDIRVLDEKENWSERTAVVTKAQHREYLKMAQEIMLEVINKLPLEEKVEMETENSQIEDVSVDKNPQKDSAVLSEEEGESHQTEELRNSEGNEDKETEEISVEPSSTPLSAAKGSYDIDFDNLDEVNPFVTKAAVQNSPVSKTGSSFDQSSPKEDRKEEEGDDAERKESNTSLSELQSVKDNPFIRLIESPAIKDKKQGQLLDAIVAEQSDDIFSQSFEDIDPFQPKKQLMNSPDPTQKTNCSDSNPDGVKNPNVKDTDENVDPFATKTNVMNTPPKKKGDGIDGHFSTELENSQAEPMEVDDIADPFATKSKVESSLGPMLEQEGTDPFQTKSKIVNSPGMQHAEMETSDPFATVSKVQNSPTNDVVTENANPFPMQTKVESSSMETDEDPFATNSKVANSPNAKEINEDINPFATKTNLVNSPICKDPLAVNSEVANSLKVCEKQTENKENSINKNEESTSIKLGKNEFERDLMGSETSASPFSGLHASKLHNSSSILQDDPFKTPTGPAKKTPKKTCPFTMSEFGLCDDDFKPASSTLFSDPADFDVLEQFGTNKVIAESALSRLSLYVKFDPLVDLPVTDPRRASIDVRRMSMRRGSVYDQKLRQLEAEESMVLMGTPPRGASHSRVAPVVKNHTPISNNPGPASNPAALDLLCSDTPEGKTEFTDVIKDTLSLNQKTDNGEIIEVLQYTEADILRIKQNLAMEFQGILLDNQREWSKKLAEKEKELGKKEEAMKEEVAKSQEKCQKAEEDTKQMISVVKEYQIIIDQLLGEKEKLNGQLKETKQELQKVKDQAVQDAQSVDTIEASFSALHKRFEKSKELLITAKRASIILYQNEETLKACVEDYQGKLQKTEERLLKLKEVAEEKLKAAHESLEKVKANSASETTRLQALVKRKEMQLESTEKSLEQKTKEFQDLTELCDQLMQRLESGGNDV